LWPFEVANDLILAERRRRITQDGIVEFLERLRRLPIQIERRETLWLWQSILPLARQHGLTAYDAAYLELAKREGIPLATLDHDLEHAGQALNIESLRVV